MLTRLVVLAALAAGVAASPHACPQYCACFIDADGYQSANCSTRALGSVQPSSIELLSFQPHEPGYPTKLAPRSFIAFKNVKFLWAVNCSVLNLPNEVFHGLDFVIRIDLSYNKIRHLNGVVFKSLGSLHTLVLRSNPLLLTPWDVIESDSLQELDLGHCGLRTIPQGTFIRVPRLSRLYLDGNEIHTFTFNMIPAGLRYLNLARNRIITVPTDVLTAMSYLRKLDLSKNPIKCNCKLLLMQDWFSGQGIIFDNGVTCLEPSQYAGQQLSKINENELCTLEEVKRQRRINDIESYRDSKTHRTHNMIHDPDLQADQPEAELYSEVLFENERTRELGTHMELSKQHYPFPSDLSDENNKLAASKQELAPTEMDLPSPTKEAEIQDEISKSISVSMREKSKNITDSSDEVSTEDLSIVVHDLISKPLSAESLVRKISDNETVNSTDSSALPTNVSSSEDVFSTNSPENEMADEGYSPLYSSTPNSKSRHEEFRNDRTLSDEPFNNVSASELEMADEGYSPSYYTSDITLQEEAGSGDEGTDISDDTLTTFADLQHKLNTLTAENSTRPTFSDPGDYSYDTHHDYSAEVVNTTESMKTIEYEGSGDFEDDANITTSFPLPTHLNEDNDTTSEGYIMVKTDLSNTASDEETSSSAMPNSPSENATDEKQTEENTTEFITDTSTIALLGISDENRYISSSESSIPSTESSSTSESPSSSSSEPSFFTTPAEASSSSTESPTSSSSEGPIVPTIFEASSSTSEMQATSQTPETTQIVQITSADPFGVEVISKTNKEAEKGQIMIEPTQAEREESPTEAAHMTLTYVIAGLLVVLIVLVLGTVLCRRISKMGPCTSKKKVRLPQDMEANLGTEMQDMLLPKPPENGVKIIPQNGTTNGKEVKEEEIPVLQKDWDEKPEPIETVTARMSILAGPQTPVFIHKTLA